MASLACPSLVGSLSSVDCSAYRLKSSSTASTSRGKIAMPNLSTRRGLVVRMEAMKPAPPSSPPGLSGTEVPLGVISSSAPLPQGNEVPVAERMAYICQDCGYVYNLETPFEEQSEDYNCPVCSAPKFRFRVQNATVGETLDVTTTEN